MDTLNGLLSQVERGVKRYSTSFGDQPRRLFDGSNYSSVVHPLPRGRLDAQPPGLGTQFLNMEYGFVNSTRGTLDAFAPPFGESELSVNPRIVPFGRQYHSLSSAFPAMRNTPAPGRHHLAAVMRIAPDAKQRNIGLHLGEAGSSSFVTADGSPVLAASPVALNAALVALQIALKDKDVAAYEALTPTGLWCGPAEGPPPDGVPDGSLSALFPQGRGFAWDGVLSQEEALEGASTSLTEGRRMLPTGAISYPSRYGPAPKLVTVVRAGQTSMYDYFGGAGLIEGATLFAILRKFPRQQSQDGLAYNLVQKPSDYAMDTSETREQAHVVTFEAKKLEYKKTAQEITNTKTMLPYEWAFVANPNGDRYLDPGYWTYEDEGEDSRTDALVVYLGRILHAPLNNVYRDPPKPEDLTPLRRIDNALGAPLMQVNLSGAAPNVYDVEW